MEHEWSEQACEDQEERRDCHHQDFMMMMIMVTGSKPASASPSSFSSGFVTPTKSSVASPDGSTGTTVSTTSCEGEGEVLHDDDDKLEKAIAKETVLYDTVLYMNTPPII
eukprot:13078603-Ditylum_brightwellii.AAC.1